MLNDPLAIIQLPDISLQPGIKSISKVAEDPSIKFCLFRF